MVRKKLKWSHKPFEIPQEILNEWIKIGNKGEILEREWDEYISKKNSKINLPHKMMHKRNFVLFPLFEIQKNWTHPDKQIDVKTLISLLPDRDIRSIKQI